MNTKGIVYIAVGLCVVVAGIGIRMFTNGQQKNVVTDTESVPLPQETDSIRSFYRLIDEKNISGAMLYITTDMIGDESSKKVWEEQFRAITKAEVKSITPVSSTNDLQKHYQVIVDITMNPDAQNAPIPYYGWQNGMNTRWITVKRIGSVWRISSINTGP